MLEKDSLVKVEGDSLIAKQSIKDISVTMTFFIGDVPGTMYLKPQDYAKCKDKVEKT